MFSINMEAIQAYLHWVRFEDIAGTFFFIQKLVDTMNRESYNYQYLFKNFLM